GLREVVAAVVGAPLARIRIDDSLRRSPQRRLPRDAVAVAHADLELRGVLQVRTRVYVVALVDRVDDRRAVIRILQREQPGGELVGELRGLGARAHDAL